MESSSSQQLPDDYTELYRRLPLKLQLSYAVGHVLNDVCASMWFTYLLVFFHFVLEFSNWETGLLLLIGQVADALATPFVGYHSDQSDNFRICAYGKRKVWHLVGTACVLGAFPFIFSSCLGCSRSGHSAQLFYYSMFIIIFQFGWAAVQISHLSLIPELTPNEHDRTKLTAIRYGFTVISNLLVYVITWVILHLDNGENSKIGPGDEPKFQHVVWTVLSFGVVCSLIFHVFVKESENDVTNNVRARQLRTSIWDLFKNIKLYQVAVVYMSSRLFVNLSQVFIPLYLHETLDMSASYLAVIPLIMFVGSFCTSMGLEKINRMLGRKLTYTIGAILGITACVWIKFGEGDLYTDCFIYIIAVLIGSSGSVILVTSIGVTTDLIGEKTDHGAFVYGVMSFTDKLANGLAVIVIQYLHSDLSNKNFYRDVLSHTCGGSIILGCITILSLTFRVRVRMSEYDKLPDSHSINF